MSDTATTLRVVHQELEAFADRLRQDRIETGRLVESAFAALVDPAFLASTPLAPLAHAEAAAELVLAQAKAEAHLARATEDWLGVTGSALGYQTADAALATLLAATGGDAWSALLTDVQLGLGAAAPRVDGALAAITVLLAGSGVPLAPRLPPATEYPPDWGSRDERLEDFRADLAEVYGSETGYPPAGVRLDAAGRVIPFDTESLLLSGAQAAKLGSPTADRSDGAVIRVVRYPTEPPTLVALIPGSAGFGFESPSDWLYNLTGGAPLQAAARDALDRAVAVEQAGDGPRAGDTAPRPVIGVVGFSQGGIAAQQLGADPDGGVALVVTAGTPDLEDAVIPTGTRVVALADPDDPVPYLDGRYAPDDWRAVEVDSGGPGFEAHSELRYAKASAGLDDDPIAELVVRSSGEPTMTDYFYVMP